MSDLVLLGGIKIFLAFENGLSQRHFYLHDHHFFLAVAA